MGLVEIWCGISYFVRIGPEMYNEKFQQIGWELTDIKASEVVEISSD